MLNRIFAWWKEFYAEFQELRLVRAERIEKDEAIEELERNLVLKGLCSESLPQYNSKRPFGFGLAAKKKSKKG